MQDLVSFILRVNEKNFHYDTLTTAEVLENKNARRNKFYEVRWLSILIVVSSVKI